MLPMEESVFNFFKRKPFPTARQARQLMIRSASELDDALRTIQLRAIVGNTDTLVKVVNKELLVAQLKQLGYNVSEKQVLAGYLAVSW